MEQFNERVLIVEDHPTLLKQYMGIVRSIKRVEVDAASTRAEALERVHHRTYHLALVDIMLNGPDDENDRGGLDVIKRIDELNEGTQIVSFQKTFSLNLPKFTKFLRLNLLKNF